MIVTVANLKGGVGKTTSSVFLAHALAAATARRCVVIDADPQASAAQWARVAAEAGRPLAVPVLAQPTTRLAKMVTLAPNVVIDTPPAYGDVVDAAIEVADFVVVPTSSSALDVSRIRATIDAAGRLGKPAAVLLTRTRRTRSVGSTEESLAAAGVRVLRTQIPLREALALAYGRPVSELFGYESVVPEIFDAVPDVPYSPPAARFRADVPPAVRPKPSPRPLVVGLGAHRAQPAVRTATGLDDDELIRRLKTSMARLAANQ